MHHPEVAGGSSSMLPTLQVSVCVCVCRRTDGRIPLKDLIRFKERQWFVEELEVRGGIARDGQHRSRGSAGPMALVRLRRSKLRSQLTGLTTAIK
jgi:hypothetical protein